MLLSGIENPSAERIKVWRCIGCGRIDGPQPCLGVCEDRKAELVFASDYDDAVALVAFFRGQAEAFEALVRRLATITPRDGEWEHSYRALQEQARRALAGTNAAHAPAGQES